MHPLKCTSLASHTHTRLPSDRQIIQHPFSTVVNWQTSPLGIVVESRPPPANLVAAAGCCVKGSTVRVDPSCERLLLNATEQISGALS